MKTCNRCKIEKDYLLFYKSKNSKDGFEPRCKECNKELKANYYLKNKELINEKNKNWKEKNKEKLIEDGKEYYYLNKEKIKIQKKKYTENNKEKISERIKKYWNETGRDKRKIRNKWRMENDPVFKLRITTKSLIYNSIINNGYTKISRTNEILGISYEGFKKFIEKKFIKGMTWENHGEWHLDHIIPISYAKTEEEVIKLNHYKNFQPLWAFDNMSKGNRFIG